MNLDICYCFPAGDDHIGYAYRFLSSYFMHPPNIEHNTVILTDPGNEQNAKEFFALMPRLRILATGSAGKDLQRYEEYCCQSNADCAMFLGGSTYCRRGGWGLKAVSAFMNLGSSNLYGACGHKGAGPVHKHIRTTGFWCSPAVFRRYPFKPRNHAERYQMEHGSNCLTAWFLAQGYQVWVVSFAGHWDLEHANDDPQGYARGSQTNLLLGDRLTCSPYQPNP